MHAVLPEVPPAVLPASESSGGSSSGAGEGGGSSRAGESGSSSRQAVVAEGWRLVAKSGGQGMFDVVVIAHNGKCANR